MLTTVKWLGILGVLGAVTGIAGALIVALHLWMVVGYMLFLVSSLSWLIVGYLTENRSLMVMNTVFTIINMIGLYTYMRLL